MVDNERKYKGKAVGDARRSERVPLLSIGWGFGNSVMLGLGQSILGAPSFHNRRNYVTPPKRVSSAQKILYGSFFFLFPSLGTFVIVVLG